MRIVQFLHPAFLEGLRVVQFGQDSLVILRGRGLILDLGDHPNLVILVAFAEGKGSLLSIVVDLPALLLEVA